MGKKRGADVTTTVAEALRLTSRQWAFVAAYATNGQNGTAAAKAAGYSGDENALAAAASRMLRLPKIRKALDQLVGKAVARVEQGTIATLAECLEFLTTVKRAKTADYVDEEGRVDIERVRQAPAGLIRKVRTHSVTQRWGKNGENETTTTTHDVEAESALVATQTLIRHYDGLDRPPEGTERVREVRTVILALISGDRGQRAQLEQLARKAAVEIAPIR